MRPTVNLLVALCYISLQDIVLNKAENIMLGKPSKMSAVHHSAGYSYYPGYANDGNVQSLAAVTYNVNPFWQGHLQGWYTINSISVTSDRYSGYEAYLESAYVGVSADDSIDCPDVEIFVCGQCPASVGQGETFTFNCSHPRPVRYVTVWRHMASLAVWEVEVEGTPTTQSGTKYQKVMNTKVQTPMTSLTVASANECGYQCHVFQPCLSFSYNPTAAPNCLLTTNPEDAAAAAGWTKYTIEKCSSNITCLLTDQFN